MQIITHRGIGVRRGVNNLFALLSQTLPGQGHLNHSLSVFTDCIL